MKNNDKWSALSMSERADLIKLYVNNGVTSLNDIKKDYNSFAPGGPIETDEYGYPADITPAVIEANYPRENEVWKRADASNADMVQRLKQGSSRATIQDWEDPRKVATHKMMSAGNYVVGNVQNINGQLFDFTDPKHGFENSDRAAIDSAIKRGDYVKFDTEGDARYFAEHYKKHYNSFGDGGYRDENAKKKPKYVDNTITVDPTDWNDTRFNFKNGDKLNIMKTKYKNRINTLETPNIGKKFEKYELPNSGGLIVTNPFYIKNALERYRDRMTPEQIEEKNRILNEAKNAYIDAYKEVGEEAPDYLQKYDYKKDDRYHDVKGQLFDWYSNPKTLEILHNRYGLSKEEVLKGVDLALSVPIEDGYNHPFSKGRYRKLIGRDLLGLIELNNFGNNDTAFHEYNHAIQDALNAYNRDYGDYYDREAEAHSYLMNTRKHLNLDPSKRDYTIEEVEKIIEEGNKNKPDKSHMYWYMFDDRNTLQEYIQESGITAPELQYQLNNWANKTNKNNTNISKFGGKLLTKRK